MLTAKKRDGTIVTLPYKMTKQAIQDWKLGEGYYCPCCEAPVILKAGDIKIPHFAHKQNIECAASSEPESPYHLEGKRSIFEWCKRPGLRVFLECYIPEIKQRADILICSKKKRYAIEFQCSVISEDEFMKRTAAYVSQNITPIWILAEKNIRKAGSSSFSFSRYHWLFLCSPRCKPLIFTFCPVTQQFGLLYGIIPFSSRTAFAKHQSYPLTELSPLKLMAPIPDYRSLVEQWRIKRHSWCLNSIYTAKSSHPFHQSLYLNRLSVSALPPEIGLPVPSMEIIETPAVYWQAWLYTDLLANKEINECIHIEHFAEAFLKRVKRGHIRLRNLPLIPQSDCDYKVPLSHYAGFLAKAGILREKGSGIFKVNRKINIPRDSEESVMMEKVFYEKFKSMILKRGME
jgi:competence protein CoiA